MHAKILISIAAGVILSALGFYFSLRHVPASDLLWYMGTVNYWWIAPAAALGLASFFIRALRWHLILGTSVRLPFLSVYHPLMIGFMINSVLPGRVGELARPAILKKKENVDFSLGITTVGAERILDALTLVLLFIWMTGSVHIDADMEMTVRGYRVSREMLEDIASNMIAVSLVMVMIVIALNLSAFQGLVKKGIRKIPDMAAPAGKKFAENIRSRFSTPAERVIDNITAGLSLIRHPRQFLLCSLYSAVIWLSQAGVFYIAVLGSPRIDLSFSQATTVFIIICLFIMLPSVPGFWGVWEAGGVFGLAIFGVPAREALGFSLAVHAVLIFPVLFAGIVSAVTTGINIVQVSYRSPGNR